MDQLGNVPLAIFTYVPYSLAYEELTKSSDFPVSVYKALHQLEQHVIFCTQIKSNQIKFYLKSAMYI